MLSEHESVYTRVHVAVPTITRSYAARNPRVKNEINMFIIHLKYFPDSDWLKAHA